MKTQQALIAAREALKGVLDAPKGTASQFWSCSGGVYEAVQCKDALALIDEALAEVQEPVAWINEDCTVGPDFGKKRLSFERFYSLNLLRYKHTPLYAAHPAPAQQKPFYIYKPTPPQMDCRAAVLDGTLPWVYDQDPSSGYCARMLVVPAHPAPAQQDQFNPDWSLLEATQESLREHQRMSAKLLEACKTGLEYVEEKLIEHDQAYSSHPATKAGRGIITSDITAIRAAIAQAEGKV